MYSISGPTGKFETLRNTFIFIFIFIETLVHLMGLSTSGLLFFNKIYVLSQVIIFLFIIGTYYIGKKLLIGMGESKKDACIIKITKDKVEIKEPNKEKIVINAKDIEAVKYGRFTNAIFFRFKDFRKYAKEYDLNDYQISAMQRKKYYWVGNKLPYLPKGEREKFKKAIEEFKRINGIK